MRKILQERIDRLTKSKDLFKRYIEQFYKRGLKFPHSSYYFHKRVLERINTVKFINLFENNLFLELVYATLSTWGLDRLDGKARLEKFIIFRESVLENLDLLTELSQAKLEELEVNETSNIEQNLTTLFANLKVMESKSKLVGISKTLHHLLPNLVLPIDRRYTLNFFYEEKFKNSVQIRGDERETFLEIFRSSHYISRKLTLNKKDLTDTWDTSIPKLIDNAIIGFVELELNPKTFQKGN